MILSSLQLTLIANVNVIIHRGAGRASISWLIQELRFEGWKSLGNAYDFSRELAMYGFTVTHERTAAGSIKRTFISGHVHTER